MAVYQCLASCGKVLIAARGSSIDLFNLENGSLLFTWTCSIREPKSSKSVTEQGTTKLPKPYSESSIDLELGSSTPPAKRRKLSAAGPLEGNHAPVQTSSEMQGKKKANNRSDAVVNGLAAPTVIALSLTKDGEHVIAVTGEDKSIRVFKNIMRGDGKHALEQTSQRMMPKRPCAIAVTEDDSTIISADKFGDVYSLPLLVPESKGQESLKTVAKPSEGNLAKPWVPAATNLTVHSQRNLKALENQQKQTNRPTERIEPTFEHELLLGHVSMLTDITLVRLEGRSYILTADRDEHIRISRSIPQAHIIEGFCLGHAEFISRLCVPKTRPSVLISGGGDDDLFVWDWLNGVLVSKANLKTHVAAVMVGLGDRAREDGSSALEPLKVAVSGISHFKQGENEGVEDIVLVTCEGVPAVFNFLLTAQNQLQHIQTIKFSGNVVAIATDVADGIIFSIDLFHKAGSTTERRENIAADSGPLERFVVDGQKLIACSTKFGIPEENDGVESEMGRLANLLYSLGNLRKRDDGKDDGE